ncbi:MAG TPA: nucleotidyltransferase family protein [Longimicrobiales bacterium]|nr:nucleotidyltransferase family protein [Longimicrobiales bacterium]
MPESATSTTRRERPAGPIATPETASLSHEERKSVTHGGFWIPESERRIYQEALVALNTAGVPYIVSGLYAVYEYTGIYRETKDLDLFFEPGRVVQAAEVLKSAGFEAQLEQVHWLGKAFKDGVQVDLIYGIGNGLFLIDEGWYRHSRPGLLAATPVRIAPPEELIFHRLFISERHRWDMSDVAHLMLMRGHELDWQRLVQRTGDHWRLLLAQIVLFDYVYPGYRERVPEDIRGALLERERTEVPRLEDAAAFRGTLLSRFSFSIDVNEWGLRDLRTEAIAATRLLPVIEEIRNSNVWDSQETDGN